MRILVTGSRDWPYPEVVYRELANITAEQPGPHTVVEGACHVGGADAAAHTWAEDQAWGGADVTSERHPADWAKHGKAAGFIRNQEMVDLGADICLVFRLNGSKGTTDTIERCRKAGIRVRIIDLRLEIA